MNCFRQLSQAPIFCSLCMSFLSLLKITIRRTTLDHAMYPRFHLCHCAWRAVVTLYRKSVHKPFSILKKKRLAKTVQNLRVSPNLSHEIYCLGNLKLSFKKKYRVVKKSFLWHFQHYQDYIRYRFFYSENYRQNTISEQILKAFGQCQN